MAEYTATTYMNPAKRVHSGVNAIAISYNFGAVSASAGDVVLLAKLPHGARVVDLKEDHTCGAAACAISIGLKTGGPAGAATVSCYLASGTIAAVNRMAIKGLAPLVSVSDASGERFGILQAQVTSIGTATVSLEINCTVFYVTDGLT